MGLIGCLNFATALAAAFLLTAGVVYCYAAYRKEAGDGGREAAQKAAAAKASGRKAANKDPPSVWDRIKQLNPVR